MKAKSWSKLQKAIYNLIEPNIHIQIHCSIYRMKSQYGSTDIPRYWITLNKEIIFDYPKQFIKSLDKMYPYLNEISNISHLIRTYIDTPKNDLPLKIFENDKLRITDYLKLADRRIGITKLEDYSKNINNPNALKII